MFYQRQLLIMWQFSPHYGTSPNATFYVLGWRFQDKKTPFLTPTSARSQCLQKSEPDKDSYQMLVLIKAHAKHWEKRTLSSRFQSNHWTQDTPAGPLTQAILQYLIKHGTVSHPSTTKSPYLTQSSQLHGPCLGATNPQTNLLFTF